MESLPAFANELDEAAAAMTATAYAVGSAGPSYEAFGADGSGQLAGLGLRLHELWAGAIEARAREASAAATHLADTAAALRAAAAAYADVDGAAHRRQAREI